MKNLPYFCASYDKMEEAQVLLRKFVQLCTFFYPVLIQKRNFFHSKYQPKYPYILLFLSIVQSHSTEYNYYRFHHFSY